MNVNEFESVLARYYDGLTTETEEQELRHFFTSASVPSHLLAQKEMFLQMDSQLQPPLPQGLAERLEQRIDTWAAQEEQLARKPLRLLRWQWIGGVAASLLLLLGVGMYVQNTAVPPTPQDTCATPEEAYAQAQKALLMLSTTLNKGVQKVEVVQQTTTKIQESVNQQLNRINEL